MNDFWPNWYGTGCVDNAPGSTSCADAVTPIAVAQPDDHYSLLRPLEAGFGLPCLNHACDATSKVMNDLFGG